jgi:hypothetical protein
MQEFKEYLKLILTTLNIKQDELLAIGRVEAKLREIKNPLNFLEFLEKNFNKEEFKFLNGYQKFIELVAKYQKLQLEALAKQKFEGAEKEAHELMQKLNNTKRQWDIWVIEVAKGNMPRLPKANELKRHGENVFIDEELKIIDSLNGLDSILGKIELFGKERVLEDILNLLKKQSFKEAKGALGMLPQKPKMQIAVKKF